jgi:phosphoserine phosphatase
VLFVLKAASSSATRFGLAVTKRRGPNCRFTKNDLQFKTSRQTRALFFALKEVWWQIRAALSPQELSEAEMTSISPNSLTAACQVMTVSDDYSGRHDTAPEAALEALMHYDGPLLLDLDGTAYLRNSTEDFLDSARPGHAALMLLRLLDAIGPWRWTGGEATRDLWRVRVVAMFIPWIWNLWRKRVNSLAAQFANRRLLDAVARRSAPTIFVTAGFQPVVAPLIAALGFPDAHIVASRMSTAQDRLRGKLATALDALGDEVVAKSMVLTDSLEDLPLLDRCARPLWTVWPDARYRHALSSIYAPGQYLTRVKRPGKGYIWHGIILEDFSLWVVCSILQAPSVVTDVIGLLALLISFWAIYERGYVDNDWAGLNYENAPKLSGNFGQIEVATPKLQPWIWASVFGLVGVYLLCERGEHALRGGVAWTAVLIVTQLAFWLYNRWDKRSRVWLYPTLQLLRSASFTVLVPIGLPACLAIGAHVVARWVPYYIYRTEGRHWPDVPVFLMRLLFYSLLWIILAISQGFAVLVTPTALLLLLWSLFRARKELGQVLARIHRIDRDGFSE